MSNVEIFCSFSVLNVRFSSVFGEYETPVFNHGVMAFCICYSFIKNPLAANFFLELIYVFETKKR